jgi:hypothetical protein
MEGVAHYSEESWSTGTSTGKGYEAFLFLRLFDQQNNIQFGKLMVNSSNLHCGIVNNHPKLLDSVFNNIARLQGSPGLVDFYFYFLLMRDWSEST